MNPEQFREAYEQYFYYILAAGIFVGLLLGAIPLILGIRRKNRNLGLIGFISAGVAGAFSPILSFLVATVFTILVVRKTIRDKVPESDKAISPESAE